ncbi:PorP/SprF family type IX secretion system membrane protein [Cryomorpha ignava]|uniref:PorP/SprF family type IX secretion system membrane protein n=1 Tax=Cryomorpha ignava TaxID=101383 RepID=UPI0019549892|nr:type IX secretion system membrane protein PorP/SprF [Cryomorpha ignava]
MLRKTIVLTIILSTICCFSFVQNVSAQDPSFTQYYANPLYLNPALAGTNKCPRMVLNFRNQWPALDGNFVTTAASYDQYVDAINGGLGFYVMNDNAGRGTLNSFNINGIYSYQLTLSKSFSMVVGFQGTYFQRSLDWSKLTFGDQIDPRRGFIYETQDTPRGGTVDNVDFSTGAVVFSENFYAGIAVHHLFEPNESLIVAESPLERKYTFHAGATIPVNKDVRGETETTISPNFLYQRQFDFVQYNIGVYVKRGPLIGGVWYRFEDSIIALMGVETDRFKVGYSYDLTTSPLSTKTAGSHEISFALNFNCRPQKKKFRAINCPQF